MLRIIGRSEYLIREHRFREYLRVTFVGKDEKTKKTIDDLNKPFGSEQQYVVAVTYAATQKIEDKVDQIAKNVNSFQNALKENREKENTAEIEQRLQRIFCNTSAPDEVEET